MADIVHTLKTHARLLHKSAQSGDERAIEKLKKLPDFKNKSALDIKEAVKRHHCLAMVAREYGFAGWSHLTHIIEGGNKGGFGTLLYSRRCESHLSVWSASYEEASEILSDNGGFLLCYKNQFILVEDDYIRTIGLDPSDPDWALIGRDWYRPKLPAARNRLYEKLILNNLK